MTSSIPNGADGIEAIKTLAQDAIKFSCTIEELSLAKPVTGLPGTVAVMFRDGRTPEVKGVKDLFEPYRTAPERREGTATVTVLQSFIDLVNRHKDEGSAIFAETVWPAPKLTAVIDYHALDNVARFGRHRVVYPFPVACSIDEMIVHPRLMKPTERAEAVRWRHVARGSDYVEVGRARVQASVRNVEEGDTVVIYRGEDDKLWAREEDEFEDGRFVRLMEDAGRG